MTRKSPLFVAALIALLALPGVALAASRGGGSASPQQILSNPRLLARYLRLTPQQVEQQKALLQALEAKVKPLREDLKELSEQIQEALDASSPNACAVGDLVIDRHEVGADIRAALEEYDAAFSAILTPEQLARYEALKDAARLLRGAGD